MPIPTLKGLHVVQKIALKELIEYAGNNSHLARMLGLPVSTVNSWVARGRISLQGAELVQANEYLKEKFPLERLRPETSF
jgi:DNA-binding transcriptional regulator YdaS (Cro superfamily)